MVFPHTFRNEAEAWIRAYVEPSGPLEVASDEPWATVLRVPLPGDDAAWFKACAPELAFEARLTAALASRWPDRLPEVLAVDESRAWLLLADAGTRLGIGGGPEPWLDVLPAYAELQRGEAVHAADHLAAGVPDRRLASFPALYEELLAREPRVARARGFGDLCAELAACGVPETVQHDDLHGHNVYVEAGPRLLDWGDACVSHPFLTSFVTFAHLGEHGLAADDPWAARLRDAYLEPWGDSTEVRTAWALAQRLGPLAHAFKELRTIGHVPDWMLPQLTATL